MKLNELVVRKLLENLSSYRDERGLYVEYDSIVISLLPPPGFANVDFYHGDVRMGGMDVSGLKFDPDIKLTLSGIEGRLRVELE